jgi:sarcosine oxidase gamma subunit
MGERIERPVIDQATQGALKWRRSERSTHAGNCAEAAKFMGGVALRSSEDNGEGPVVWLSPDEWRSFADGVGNGDFDDLLEPSE